MNADEASDGTENYAARNNPGPDRPRPPLVRLPQAGEGVARCCGRECDYSVERVRWHLDRLLAYERAGEEPRLPYASPLLERYGAAPGDGPTATIDVKRAVEHLRALGEPITPESVSAILCPWSTDDPEANVIPGLRFEGRS